MSGSQKYGHLTLDDGGKRGPRQMRLRTKVELDLDDRMRRRVMRLVNQSGAVPSRAIQEIREGKQAPWRSNGRRALELNAAGCTNAEIKDALAEEFARWVDDSLVEQPRRKAA